MLLRALATRDEPTKGPFVIQIQHNKKSTNHQYHNSITHNQKNLIENKISLRG